MTAISASDVSASDLTVETASTVKLPPGRTYRGPLATLNLIRRLNADTIGMMEQFRSEFGTTFTINAGDSPLIVFSEPSHIQEIVLTQASKFNKASSYKDAKQGLARFMGNGLVTSDGEFWKRQRKMVAPAMHAKRIASYADAMTDITAAQIDQWKPGTRIDVAKEMMTTTLRIIAKTGFNVDVSNEQVHLIERAVEGVEGVAGGFQILPTWLPTPTELKARRGLVDLDTLIYGIIDERRKSGEDRGDLLSMLLLTEDDQGQRMTDREARDEAVTMFLAGHETTSNALAWTFYLLSLNPDVEAKLHAELDSVLGGRLPTVADLPALKYTDMVIKESMRIRPPVWGFSRENTEPVQIGEYFLPKGSDVNVTTWLTHHDERFFPEPNRFDPERFTSENEAKIPRYAYLPFGGGARICIGNSFASMEARLLLATIASRYTLRLSPGQKVEMSALITLIPKGGLPMWVQARG